MTDTEREQLVTIMRDAIAVVNNSWITRSYFDRDAHAVINAAIAAGWRFLPPVGVR